MNKYSQKYIVTNDCMDLNYTLRPISAIMYFQDCFARYMTTKNLAAFDVIKQNLFWVISELNIELENEQPFWSEEIEVTTWVSEITKLKIYFDFYIKHNEKIFVKGNCCCFILNTETKRPHTTEIVSDKVEICSEFVLGEHKKFSLPETTEKVVEITHKTNLSDLDFNYHVNNKSYINIAEMTAPDDFKTSKSLKTLSIKFNKEAFLNDELICSAYKTNTPDAFVHKITKDGVSICEISTSWREKTIINDISTYKLKVRS